MKRSLLILAAAAALVGCASRGYEGTDANGRPFKLRSNTVLVSGQLQRLEVNERGLKIGHATSQTEVEKLEPLIGAVAAGVAKGLKP